MVNYNIFYDIAAFIMLLVIILLYFMRRGISNYQNRLFLALILCAFFGTTADIVDIIFIGAGSAVPIWMKYISSGSCFILHGLEAMLVMFYFLGITNSWWKTKPYLKVALVVPYLIIFFLVITSYKTHLIYYYDEAGNYYRGSICMLTYLLAIFYLFIAVVYIYHLRKFLSKETHIILTLITIIAATGAVIQLMVPGLVTQMFATMLSLYIIFFTLQNPYLAIDNNLHVYNRSSFLHMTSLNFATGKEMSMILMVIDDYSFMQSSFGARQMRSLLREIAKNLKALNRNILVYHITDASFCLVLDGQYSQQKVDLLLDTVDHMFDRPWKINDISTILALHLCQITCPKDADSVERIFEIVSYMLKQKQSEKRLRVCDMDIKAHNQQREKEQLIKEAILGSRYELCYRGLHSLVMDKTNSAELSLRILDLEGDYLYSGECKELLEKTGLIFEVGILLFRAACIFIRDRRELGDEIESVEIGISIFLCMQQEYLDEIADLMKEYKIKPGMIRLKISESEAMDSTKQLQEMMKKFSEVGLWFSLDGYGTGYFNISYIYELPFSHIEIEKKVFQASLTDKKAMEILKNSIQMLHELDMQVVICDVLPQEQQDILRNIGCDYVVDSYRTL